MTVPADMPHTVVVTCGFPRGTTGPTCDARVVLPADYRLIPGARRRYRRTLIGRCPHGHAIAEHTTVRARSGPGAPPGPAWAH